MAYREFVRSRTIPTGMLARTAVPNMTLTRRPAAEALTPSDARMSGVTLAGTSS